MTLGADTSQTNMFLEATFQRTASGSGTEWRDVSTPEHHAFASAFGTIRLRRRENYPATFSDIKDGVLCLGYGDVSLMRAAEKGTLSLSQLSEEFLFIEIDCAAQTVRILRDTLCTLPLFAWQDDHTCAFSNDFSFVVAHSSRLNVSAQGLAGYLIDEQLGSSTTLFEDLHMLGESELWVWRNGKLHMGQTRYASWDEAFDADPKMFRKAFEEVLQTYAQKYSHTSGKLACEFSAGIDSSIVAGFLADQGHAPILATIEFNGMYASGHAQKVRDFYDRFPAGEYMGEVLDEQTDFPLSHMGVLSAWRPFYQYEETYYAIWSRLLDRVQATGAQYVFNGLAGDELLSRTSTSSTEQCLKRVSTAMQCYTAPFQEWCAGIVRGAVVAAEDGILPRSVIRGKAGHANLCIERGMWPVSPLADPRLRIFCRSLKMRYRMHKNIYRIYAKAWQYPESIYHPDVNEDFADFFTQSVKRNYRPLLIYWMEHSLFAKQGWLRPEDVLTAFDRASTTDELYACYKLIKAESNLQLLKASLPSQD